MHVHFFSEINTYQSSKAEYLNGLPIIIIFINKKIIINMGVRASVAHPKERFDFYWIFCDNITSLTRCVALFANIETFIDL